jgi:RNA polymerase sigma factor (sigma-70 family)
MNISIVTFYFDFFNPMHPHLPPNLIIEFNKENQKVRGKVCALLIPNITDLIHERMGRTYDAADLTQEVFKKFLLKKRTYKTMRHLENYVQRIVNSSCIDEKKKHEKRKLHAPYISGHLVNLQNRNSENLRNIRVFQRLTDLAVEMLPARSREVYMLSYCEGLSTRQTAEKMGITISTVENLRNTMFKKLRMEIREKPGMGGGHVLWWVSIPFLIFYMLIQKLLS